MNPLRKAKEQDEAEFGIQDDVLMRVVKIEMQPDYEEERTQIIVTSV